MELFQRKKTFSIENIYIQELEKILNYSDVDVRIKKILYDNIILNNGKRIKCIYNYYYNNKGITIKKNSKTLICPKIQIIYNIQHCEYYDCNNCHLQMINKLKNKEIKLLNK